MMFYLPRQVINPAKSSTRLIFAVYFWRTPLGDILEYRRTIKRSALPFRQKRSNRSLLLERPSRVFVAGIPPDPIYAKCLRVTRIYLTCQFCNPIPRAQAHFKIGARHWLSGLHDFCLQFYFVKHVAFSLYAPIGNNNRTCCCFLGSLFEMVKPLWLSIKSFNSGPRSTSR